MDLLYTNDIPFQNMVLQNLKNNNGGFLLITKDENIYLSNEIIKIIPIIQIYLKLLNLIFLLVFIINIIKYFIF